MTRQLLKDGLGWGFLLWLAGYVLGLALFPFVPTGMIGWIIMPIGVALTLLVLIKKVDGSLVHYLQVGLVWVAIAVVLDFIFLVMLLNPADGYYKLDVYLYYALLFSLPLAVGLRKIEIKNR